MWTLYKHTCTTNGKSYVGLTSKSLEARWKEHLHQASQHSEYAFHRAISKYGVDAWTHEILETQDDPIAANDAEIRLIAEHKTFIYDHPDLGYNMTKGGQGNLGLKFSHSDDVKQRISDAGKGRVLSGETRHNISLANTGKVRTDEQRQRISESHKGYEASEETKLKLSEALSGRSKSDEHKAKIGRANKGRKHTEESRRNMSESRKGMTQSEETRKKRSESLKAHYARLNEEP